MFSVIPYHSIIPYHTSLDTGGINYSTSQFTRVPTSHQQNTDAAIVTAEGDTVALSWGSEIQATYAAYNSFTRITGESTRLQAQGLLFEIDRELSISVDGNLNRQELKDIKEAIKTIDSIMRDFLSGDIADAVAKALEIPELESISSLKASLEFEQSVSLKQQLVTDISSSSPKPLEAITQKGDIAALEDINKLTDKMTKVVQDSGVNPANLLKPIRKVFSQLLKELSKENPLDSLKPATAKLIMSDLLKRIQHLPQIEENRGTEQKENEHQAGIPPGAGTPTLPEKTTFQPNDCSRCF
jgi:hypothetical protein